jgi:high-affinity nickel-transport protein
VIHEVLERDRMTLTDPALPEAASFRWRREDTLRTAGLLAVIAALHVAAFGVLFLLVVPEHYQLGSKAFGIGLGVTAYTLGIGTPSTPTTSRPSTTPPAS